MVSIRASFRVDPDGKQRVAPTQTEVHHAPLFEGDPARTEMLADSDFVLSKTGTDVLVSGRAVAPGGRPATSTAVRLKVADIDKTLEVVGERLAYQGALGTAMTDPMPYLDMPLTWARAYGGYDPVDPGRWNEENPAGRGYAAKPDRLREMPAPNIQYPDAPFRGADFGRPAGFGPVAHHWLPRRGFGGTYDEAWSKTRDPLLPVDFDRRFFRCAPVDQQTAEPLQGYEQVWLGGVTTEGLWSFLLPRITFDIVTSFRRGGDQNRRAQIHTLWLSPDQRRFEIIYLSALEVPPGQEERLISTTIRIRPRYGISAAVQATGVWSPQ